ncbi:molybdate ABC transporter substrate-binding protein [Microbacterium sp. H1-D42]|uniref:molybdate ABC transporter substrate-binding protein n=1 Tax=Microbacterium sp. H1-D42 TaxID=2925844 RepID=UPI001F534F0C|nr:molybdate ABC transporter substrate-binding protein [Microbacterium sp. H1-D42]UNK71426.1 molybdate ABC transporter substrate-binding protein [Microbacterium sp. H1-D42]
MRIRTSIAVLATLMLLAGCASASDTAEPGDPAPTASGDQLTGEVTVFAAASLRTAFDEIAEAFEQQHPKVTVNPIVYDGSSTLVTQLQEGAQADVLATADERNMQVLVESGLASDPQVFATNTLVLAFPADNPGDVTALADLANVVTVLCAPEVPCGKASATLLDNAGVHVTPASLEQNVTAVLQKLAAGEADAGLVYATDVIGEDAVHSVVPDGAADVVNRYPVVALDGAGEAGVAFAEFVRGEKGQQILSELGFGAP